MKTMIINSAEVLEILDIKQVVEAVRGGYMSFNRGQVVLPPIVSLDVEKHHGEMDFKIGYSQNDDVIAIKMAAGYWDNPKKYNLPSGVATICLLDAKTAVPLCILDGTHITAYRTAAAGALASTVLARKDAKTLGVIGTGEQARMQVIAHLAYFDMQTVRVWGRPEGLERYMSEMRERLPGIEWIACATPHDAVCGADIVVTTTASHEALVDCRSITPGTHINAIGCDMQGKQELDAQIFKTAKVVQDNTKECNVRGETQHAIAAGILRPEDVYAEIGEILIGKKPGRVSNEEITIFDSTGMSIQDIVTSLLIYNQARERDMGLYVELI